MTAIPPTVIVRDRHEKPGKCSVTPLRGRPEYLFHTYPLASPPELAGYVRLGLDGPPLGPADAAAGLLLLDASWRNVVAMEKAFAEVPGRTLPAIRTAFPRVSKLGHDPDAGLATVEALYVALLILGRPLDGVLDDYRWRVPFLTANAALFARLAAAAATGA